MIVILVLGNSNKDVMNKRLDRALEEFYKITDEFHPEEGDIRQAYIMVSGCGGSHEYKYMYDYLSKKIKVENIIVEDKSNSTYENLLFSTKILINAFQSSETYHVNIELIVCTSTFHIKRTILLTKLINFGNISYKYIHTNETEFSNFEKKEIVCVNNLINNYVNSFLDEKIQYPQINF